MTLLKNGLVLMSCFRLQMFFSLTKRKRCSITHANEVEFASQQLARKCQLVAIKLGPDGALACLQNQITVAKSIDLKVVDTVGAGDSF